MNNKRHRQQLREKYGGRCAYCGEPLGAKWHADHIKPIYRDSVKNGGKLQNSGTCRYPENGKSIDDYNPACCSCNVLKSTFSIEKFRENIQNYIASLNKYSVQYKVAKRYGLVQETKGKVVFFFEKS